MTNYLLGLDEAGRGSVLGPLVVASASCDRKHERKLNKLCKKDSKQLSAKQRVEILDEIKKFCEFKDVTLSAEEITQQMEKDSLNTIEARAMASLIKNVKDADIMIDLPDRYAWVFRSRMDALDVTRFEAEHKADEKYPIVAAASIYAKVKRDNEIELLKSNLSIDFGSGYPSDPKTRSALKNKASSEKLSKFIRKKWKTLETIKQTKLFED